MKEMIQDKLGVIFGVAGNVDLPGGLSFAPSYLQAGLIVFMIFLLVLTLGQLRKRYLGWHISGILPGVTFGFVIAILLEGILIVGGNTILTKTFGWKGAPKPITKALDVGRAKMADVLGAASQDLVMEFEKLSVEEQKELQEAVCASN